MSHNPLDRPGEVFDLSLMSPNPTSSKTKDGPIYRISFEVERETWDCFMAAKTAGMLIAAKACVVAHDEGESLEKTTKKKPKGPYSQQAKKLWLSSFLRNPKVWQAVGTDQQYLEWLRTQECAAKRLGGCEGDVVVAHVRRIAGGAGTGIKPSNYSAIPLCNKHHMLQHQKGEKSFIKEAAK